MYGPTLVGSSYDLGELCGLCSNVLMVSIAALIVSRLRDAGVGALFGVPGGGSNLDVIDAAQHAGLPFVLTSSETAGAIAAIAQAEISGRPGACLTTLGPGVASAVNGVACARLERAPLLAFTDSQAASGGGLFEHQRLDHRALLAPVTKWSATIGPDTAGDIIDQAIACAIAAPPGPVHLECPADVCSQIARGADTRVQPPLGRSPTELRLGSPKPRRREGGAYDLPQFERLISRARKPLLLIGLGARRAVDAVAIRALCAHRHLPAMVTYKAKGVVPDSDLHFAGVFTNGAVEQPIVNEADLLIGVGLDPVEVIPRPWKHAQPIVYCGPWAVDDRHVPFATQLVTTVATGIREIDDRLAASTWDLDTVHRAVLAQRKHLCPASQGLAPHRVVQVAAEAAARTARVTIDAGAHMLPATTLWPVAEPNQMLISNGLSTMGFALPAAIGAALLRDTDSPGMSGMPGMNVTRDGPVVVALTGDGGLLMCVGELLTAVREKLRVIIVVFRDGSLSLIDVKQRQRQYASAGVSLGEVAWTSIAESFRMAAHVATTDAELARALASALEHRGPTLIEARIDPSGYTETLRAIRG